MGTLRCVIAEVMGSLLLLGSLSYAAIETGLVTCCSMDGSVSTALIIDVPNEPTLPSTASADMPPSHQEAGYMYLSPVPGAQYVSSQTRYFLVRFKEGISPQALINLQTFIDIRQEGASQSHSGQAKIASDGRTVVYEVSSSFSANRLVTVTLSPNFDGVPFEPYQYQFMVAGPMPGTPSEPPAEPIALEPARTKPHVEPANSSLPGPPADGPAIMSNGVSVPSNFPRIDITVNDSPDPGYIFLDNRSSGSNSYNVIFDNAGSPVWYAQSDDERRDMKVQHNGMLTMLARDGGQRFIGLDTTYTQVAAYRAVNGYATDEHELQVLENGRYLLLGVRGETVDMSRYVSGGNPSCSVGQTVIQEFTPEGDLIFQWRAWDHFDVADVHLDNVRGGSFRFPHMNAIDIDDDGHILLSSRHLSEITKINRDTGEIVWRLSGIPKNSDFAFVNDPLGGPRNQHALRHTGSNRYLMFDNGNLHSPSMSRGVEYELDLENMTATVVWQYPRTPTTAYYSHYMGNAQRLPNGNTLINWAVGHLPKLTEVRPDGAVAFEMNWVNRHEAYRVWRHEWNGMALRPHLIIEPQPNGVALLFNKFGDPDVDYYRIYGSLEGGPWKLLMTSAVTLKTIAGLEDGGMYDFRVTAVDPQGRESEPSNVESAVIRTIRPGENLLINGDFSAGQTGWTWAVTSPAWGDWLVEDGVSRFAIASGGTQLSQIQLSQGSLPLIQGDTYIFEFTAWSAAPRTIETRVGDNIFTPSLVPNRRRFQYVFPREEPSDYDGRVSFNLGYGAADVYLDEVSLSGVIPGDLDYDGTVGAGDLHALAQEWLDLPEAADLNDDGRVDYDDFVVVSAWWGRSRPFSTTLVSEAANKRVLVPTQDIGRDWIGTAEPYDDSAWAVAAGGVGYENSPGNSINYVDLIDYSVQSQMSGRMTSCYIRIPFELDFDPSTLTYLLLNIRYDDGFVAYLNGQELTRDNLNAAVPDWDDNADDRRGDLNSRLLEPFRVNREDRPELFEQLHHGPNILTIHALNVSTGSSDFLVSAELRTGK